MAMVPSANWSRSSSYEPVASNARRAATRSLVRCELALEVAPHRGRARLPPLCQVPSVADGRKDEELGGWSLLNDLRPIEPNADSHVVADDHLPAVEIRVLPREEIELLARIQIELDPMHA